MRGANMSVTFLLISNQAPGVVQYLRKGLVRKTTGATPTSVCFQLGEVGIECNVYIPGICRCLKLPKPCPYVTTDRLKRLFVFPSCRCIRLKSQNVLESHAGDETHQQHTVIMLDGAWHAILQCGTNRGA